MKSEHAETLAGEKTSALIFRSTFAATFYRFHLPLSVSMPHLADTDGPSIQKILPVQRIRYTVAGEVQSVGRYEGRSVVELLDDGRRVKLVEPYAFVDAAELRWDVPAKAIVDGASIPQALWSFMGGPFEGKYRSASIIHDWYCDIRVRKWKDVHRMFYEAMLTSGVSKIKAKIMYGAVYGRGPRWSDTVVENSRSAYGTVPTIMASVGSGNVVLLSSSVPGSEKELYQQIVRKAVVLSPVTIKRASKKSVSCKGSLPRVQPRPRSYRPKMTDDQLLAVTEQIKGSRLNLDDIEHLVDSMR